MGLLTVFDGRVVYESTTDRILGRWKRSAVGTSICRVRTGSVGSRDGVAFTWATVRIVVSIGEFATVQVASLWGARYPKIVLSRQYSWSNGSNRRRRWQPEIGSSDEQLT